MIKYVYGLGLNIGFDTDCDEICDFLESFYYLSGFPYDKTKKPIEVSIERLGKN